MKNFHRFNLSVTIGVVLISITALATAAAFQKHHTYQSQVGVEGAASAVVVIKGKRLTAEEKRSI